jgi:hypothetical protein
MTFFRTGSDPSMPHSQAFLRAAISLTATLLLVSPLHAGEASARRATAQALFEQGRRLIQDGDASRACPKFEESQRLDPGVGTQFNLADCYEQVGKLASAYALYTDVAAATRQAGQQQREEVARGRARALKPRLSKLMVEVSEGARVEGLVVRRDGVEVGPAQWGFAVPVDPGTHEVTAVAPDMKEWSGTVEVKNGASEHTLLVPPLVPLPKKPEQAAAQTEPEAGGSDPHWDTDSPDSRPGFFTKPWNVAGVSVGALGLIAMGGGAYFGLQAMTLKDDSEQLGCNANNECTTDLGIEKRRDAEEAGQFATLGFIAGGACLAASATMIFLVPRLSQKPRTHARASLRVMPALGPEGAALHLTGAW